MQQSIANTSAAWPEVLARVEQALTQTIVAAQRREQALTPANAAGADNSPPAWLLALARIQERLAGLEDRTREAWAKVADADTVLAEGETALRDWLQATEGARAKLMDWAGGGDCRL